MVLANEYASQYDPEGLVFDIKVLDQFVKSAPQALYRSGTSRRHRRKNRGPG